ncbi:5-oxoprolinase subunit PxpA [Ornithinibacillus sp. L9]|uniref:5-oxoprolinase subunit A n=1 Tax=Ornithinibacillus caprae TaxID=2678566 RepID=A0A6N8FII6_9BACI|nr:5-oxoprolinase subunit PxpA [Ornithinibacillus caprae]MUK89051.1 5-oxoprolinase subunit PxpA [Ornithinibacillus caprae]
MQKRIDLNCDMGESFGAFKIGSDEELMKWITSANIACGAHAGDPHVMDRTVQLAKQYGVAIGAHPGFPDLAGFGRRVMDFSSDEIYRSVIYQIGSLQAFCHIHDVQMKHVKPHGALYNLAARNRQVADAIAKAVYDLDSSLVLFGLAGSELLAAGRAIGLAVASEVFADRSYQPDGSLTPRNQEGALIEDVNQAVTQVTQMVAAGEVKALNGETIAIEADTVCIHGDGTDPVRFVTKLRESLADDGMEVVTFDQN